MILCGSVQERKRMAPINAGGTTWLTMLEIRDNATPFPATCKDQPSPQSLCRTAHLEVGPKQPSKRLRHNSKIEWFLNDGFCSSQFVHARLMPDHLDQSSTK